VSTITIDCDDLGWGFKLLSPLNNHEEATLIHFDYCAHRKLCEETASRFGMETEHDPKAKIFRFRKPK